MQTLEQVNQVGQHAPQSALITQGFREGLGVAKAFVHPFECDQWQEGAAQVELQIDGLLPDVSALWEMPQGRQCLLKIGHRLMVRRVRRRLGPGLPAVGYGLLPHLALQGMMGQAFDLFSEAVRLEPFDGLHNPCVQCAPLPLQQIAIGHLAGESMFEHIFNIGKEAPLVEELGGLQMCQALPGRLLRQLRNGLQEDQRQLRTDH